MHKPFWLGLIAVVGALMLSPGCGGDSGVTTGIPPGATGGAAHVMPGGEPKNLKEVRRSANAAQVMP
jgi:hypothetical protein